MEIIHEIAAALQKGKAKIVRQFVMQAIEEGYDPRTILDEGLLSGMVIISDLYKCRKIFVPEVLVSARAMNAGIDVLRPKLIESNIQTLGRALVGTIEGDLHDIGKNLVAIMLKGAGFDVTDIGVDVPPAEFIAQAEKIEADIICVSALLTTTMAAMKGVTELLEQKGVRGKYIVMVGGAPVNQSFANYIGADYYTADACECAATARKAIEAIKNQPRV